MPMLRLGKPSEATPLLDLSAPLLMYCQCSAPLLQTLLIPNTAATLRCKWDPNTLTRLPKVFQQDLHL